jgi:hypothetical protein
VLGSGCGKILTDAAFCKACGGAGKCFSCSFLPSLDATAWTATSLLRCTACSQPYAHPPAKQFGKAHHQDVNDEATLRATDPCLRTTSSVSAYAAHNTASALIQAIVTDKTYKREIKLETRKANRHQIAPPLLNCGVFQTLPVVLKNAW